MRIAVITGASSGMGRESVLQLNDEIEAIEEFWLIGRRQERMEAISALLTKRSRILSWDLGDESSFLAYGELLRTERPEIVFLVNAAGFGKIGQVSELPLEDCLGMCTVNVRALTAFCRISLPYMARRSRILNFASAAAFLPQPRFAVYAATKSYVLSFTRALNQELLGSGCTATAVCPGPVRTEFFERAETTGEIPLYKHLFMADSRKVVRKAVIDAVLQKELSVYGLSMQLFLALSKLPQGLLLRVLHCITGRKCAGD